MSSIQCVICTELMTDECILLYLGCGHVFHDACVRTWIQRSRTCPECRRHIVVPRTGTHRLYLNFTDDPRSRAREKSLNDKLKDYETFVNDLLERMNTLEADKLQMNEQLAEANETLVAMRNENAVMKFSKEEMARKLMELQCEYSYSCLVENSKLELDNVELSA